MIDLGDWCPRCMVCARLMHKKNTSKDCDRRDSNVDNNNYNNNNNNKWCEFSSVQSTKWLFLSAVSRSNWNLECWFFCGGKKTGGPGEKLWQQGQEPKNDFHQHVKPGLGIDPRPQQWEARVLTTAPSLLIDTSTVEQGKGWAPFHPKIFQVFHYVSNCFKIKGEPVVLSTS